MKSINELMTIRYQLVLMLRLLGMFIAVASGLANAAEKLNFETYSRPFVASSLWNSYPVSPKFSNFIIPPSSYFPAVQEGAYSTGCFVADNSDRPTIIKSISGKSGIYDADAEVMLADLTVPHWPANVEPASGSDGHADIFDVSTGVIYSFWQLKRMGNDWVASKYAWTKINGRGWGDPAQYFHGARAAAVPSCAGIIRKGEVNDGDSMYRHALAMSLTFNALSATPAYIYPATSADTGSAKNTGEIPEGALLMLPPSFDISSIKTPELKKVVNTLKTYGAYVVDRNYGTPFHIYVEIGSGFSINKYGWNSTAANELHLIRQGLRQVTSADGWVDGNGNSFTPQKIFNLLSMRGPWTPGNGKALGQFDTWHQAVVFGQTSGRVVQNNYSGRSISGVNWAKPVKGEQYKLTAITTGEAKLRLKIVDNTLKKPVFDSKDLENNQSVTFQWPANDFTPIVTVTSGVGGASTVSGTLIKVE